jgi:hypothetical protein
MDKYQDKEASMDDYSHEKKLKADGRYMAEKGDVSAAKDDFDHAHALKKDAHDDAVSRKEGGSFLSKHWNHSSPLNNLEKGYKALPEEGGVSGLNKIDGDSPIPFIEEISGVVDGIPYGAADVDGSIAVDVGYPDTQNRG